PPRSDTRAVPGLLPGARCGLSSPRRPCILSTRRAAQPGAYRRFGDGALVPGERGGAHDERPLVTLARADPGVAGGGIPHRRGDRFSTVGDDHDVVAAPAAGCGCTGRNLLQDDQAVLLAWVLVGDHGDIGQARRDGSHGGALLGVT